MNLNLHQKKFESFLIIFSLIYILFVFLAILSVVNEVKNKKLQNETLKILNKMLNREVLENLTDDDEFLIQNKGRNIFFIDGNPEEVANITNVKKACSVESAGNFIQLPA